VLLKLLGLPVTLPAAGIRYCLSKVADVADRELYDVDHLNEELILLRDAKERRKAEAALETGEPVAPAGATYVVEMPDLVDEDAR